MRSTRNSISAVYSYAVHLIIMSVSSSNVLLIPGWLAFISDDDCTAFLGQLDDFVMVYNDNYRELNVFESKYLLIDFRQHYVNPKTVHSEATIMRISSYTN